METIIRLHVEEGWCLCIGRLGMTRSKQSQQVRCSPDIQVTVLDACDPGKGSVNLATHHHGSVNAAAIVLLSVLAICPALLGATAGLHLLAFLTQCVMQSRTSMTDI